LGGPVLGLVVWALPARGGLPYRGATSRITAAEAHAANTQFGWVIAGVGVALVVVRLAYGWIEVRPEGLRTSRWVRGRRLAWSDITGIEVTGSSITRWPAWLTRWSRTPVPSYQTVHVSTRRGRRRLPVPYTPWVVDSDFDADVVVLRRAWTAATRGDRS
jgi:hypothetical protein